MVLSVVWPCIEVAFLFFFFTALKVTKLTAVRADLALSRFPVLLHPISFSTKVNAPLE